MKQHFFTVAAFGGEADAQALNQLLGSHKVVEVQREFVADGVRSHWAFCVVTTSDSRSLQTKSGRSRVDYKEVLSSEQFRVYARLRLLRKRVADQEGVPPYAVFNNAQLAEMVTGSVRTTQQIAAINGVGKARVEKYAQLFLEELKVSSEEVAHATT